MLPYELGTSLRMKTHAARADEASIGALCWLSLPMLASAQLADSDSRDPYHTRRAILPPLLRNSICSGELQLLTFPLASPFGQLWREETRRSEQARADKAARFLSSFVELRHAALRLHVIIRQRLQRA